MSEHLQQTTSVESALSTTVASAVPGARWQAAVGAAVVGVALVMAIGASMIPGDAGYSGVGANFVPWLCAAALALCGVWLIGEALTGGYRKAAEPGGSAQADVGACVWVSAGLLLNAGLIEHIGFVVACTLCFTLAVQGLRRAQGQQHTLSARSLGKDVLTGLLLSAPVFWAFTQFLAIHLPGLTETGWL